MDSGDRWRLGHRPGLDGLRGVAILLVVASHADVTLEPLGGVGVTVFFTLSGFLITALLLQERDSAGRVSFGGFYRRRVRRLMPAFVLMFVVVTALSIVVGGRAPYWWAVLLEAGNWVSATRGAGALYLMHHTWSLAIEEQFYLVWPIVLVTTLSRFGRRGVLVIAGCGSVLSVVLANVLDGPRVAFGTDTNAVSLLAGCLLAALMVDRRVLAAPAWVLPAGLALILCGANPPDFVQVPFVPVGTVLAIWAVGTTKSRALSWRPLRFAGRISYGWYLWNFPLTMLLLRTDLSQAWAAVLSLGVALVSWRFVERPILSRGQRRRGVSAHDARPHAPVR